MNTVQPRGYLPLAKIIVELENAVESRTRAWYGRDDDECIDLSPAFASARVKAAETALLDIINAMLARAATRAIALSDSNVVALTMRDLLVGDDGQDEFVFPDSHHA